MVEVETQTASPFAGSLLFEYVASYMYEDDTPAAERRAQALSLNRDLLRELLGQEELRDLIDPDALAQIEADLQGLSERARARSADGLHDLLRRVGDLTPDEMALRVEAPAQAPAMVDALIAERRAVRVRVGGEARVIAAEDAGRYRDALGVMTPAGLPDAFLEPVPDALRSLLARYARTRGPFHTAEPAARYDLPAGALDPVLGALETDGTLVRGELRPGGSGREWCDAEVVRRLRRASLAALRKEIEPADPRPLGVSFPTGSASTAPAARAARTRCARCSPASRAWRCPRPSGRPRCCPAGWPTTARRAWTSWPRAARSCGWAQAPAASAAAGSRSSSAKTRRLVGPPPADPPPEGPVAGALREALAGGASFWDDLLVAADAPREDVFTALWALVWAGEVTNDLWLPLRAPRRLPALTRPSAGGLRRRRAGGARGAPSAVAGRWSLAERLFRDAPAADERRRILAELLVERHGVLTRSAVLSEGVPGGYAAVYPALTDLETLGTVRRGYFVAGLGGPSSRCRARSSGFGTCATRPSTATPTCWCSAPPTPPSPTAPPPRGRGARAPPARRRARSGPRWSWWTARPPCTWSAAAAAS